MTEKNRGEQDAIVFCHGILFKGLSADRAYKCYFAPDANSPHAGKLNRAEVRQMFKQYGKTRARRPRPDV